MILAGVMLKMGAYGFLRFAIPLFPTVAVEAVPLFLTLAVIGIIYGALVAMVQPDLKRLVAYSSVSHLGFVMLGMFALDPQGVTGSIYQMLNHGVSTGGLFLLVGMLYMRRHTREISEFGGLWKSVPVYAAIFMVVMLSSVGLPGLNGFVGEFLILLGTFLRQLDRRRVRGQRYRARRAVHSVDLRARDVRADHQGRKRNYPRPYPTRDRRDGSDSGADALHGALPETAHRSDGAVGRKNARARAYRRSCGFEQKRIDRDRALAQRIAPLHAPKTSALTVAAE